MLPALHVDVPSQSRLAEPRGQICSARTAVPFLCEAMAGAFAFHVLRKEE